MPAARRKHSGGILANSSSELVDRVAVESEHVALLARARKKPSLQLSERGAADLELIATGAYSPIDGFMTQADYRSVVRDMHLANGQPWSLPITLAVSVDEARQWTEGDAVRLVDPSGFLLGVLHLEERYRYDKREEAQAIYGTTEEAHPGVAVLAAEGDVRLGGKVRLLARRKLQFPKYALDPAQSRALFKSRGWRTVVGFQTRNPVHRAHEHILKVASEIVDGLFFQPLVGETKADDIPADVRIRCYEVLLENYFVKDRFVFGMLPAAMRYAGPREAIFHALVRRNYGCTHFIIGRDHAGVGNYYGPYDAHRIFERFAPGELGVTPVFLENAFFCRRCDDMATEKTCPHDRDQRVTLSGTAVRAMLRGGQAPPPEFSRPEVAAILIEAARAEEAEEG